MNICLAQTKSIPGNISANLVQHQKFIEIAALHQSDLIVFPELSLTGYEPKLAKELAFYPDDNRLNALQKMSDTFDVGIAIGLPVKIAAGILIGMLIFQPHKSRQLYSKQYLHADELPYFVPGDQEFYLTLQGYKIAFAICYESLVPEHFEKAIKNNADIYIASVAKAQKNVEKAFHYFSSTAQKFSKTILMSNCVGPCDDFIAVGSSAVWNNKGTLLAQLDKIHEGLLIFKTEIRSTLNVGI